MPKPSWATPENSSDSGSQRCLEKCNGRNTSQMPKKSKYLPRLIYFIHAFILAGLNLKLKYKKIENLVVIKAEAFVLTKILSEMCHVNNCIILFT